MEYMVDFNATQAALRAGYSATSAHTIGHENLMKPEIANHLQLLMQKRAEKVDVTADYVLRIVKETVEAAKAEGKHGDTLKGAELLGKHISLWTERLEIYDKTPKVIKDDIPNQPEK